MSKIRAVLILLLLAAVPAQAGYLENCDAAIARSDDHISLACNIYWEASNQPIEGQMAVALVTMNRVLASEYPDTFSKVVWQWIKHKRKNRVVAQFSWTLDGKPDTVHNQRMWNRALQIASLFTVTREQILDRCPNIELQWKIDDMLGWPRRPLVPCASAILLQKSRLSAAREVEDVTGGALYYHADYVRPIWRHKLLKTAKIGAHIFYAPRK
jgi:hypothetical protein